MSASCSYSFTPKFCHDQHALSTATDEVLMLDHFIGSSTKLLPLVTARGHYGTT
jgi:hypothetical protein